MRLTPPEFYSIQKKEKIRTAFLLIPLFMLFLVLVLLIFLPFKLLYVLADLGYPPRIEDILNEAMPEFADYMSAIFNLSAVECGIIGFLAAGIALFNWFRARKQSAYAVVTALSARPPDPSDACEKRYRNVVGGLGILTGLPVIQPYVLPSRAYNAFALSDSRGRTLIAVTRGIIMDFDKIEMQSIVAHELSHVMRGDSFYVTFITFLIRSFVRKSMDHSILTATATDAHFSAEDLKSGASGAENRDRTLIDAYLFLLRPVVWAMRLFACFISRKRELMADATAVGLTLNPFALARAIHKADKGNSDLGPRAEAFNHLFIIAPRNKGIDVRKGFWADLFSSHPPVQRRLWILLIMARKSFDDLYKDR
jgi:heat shock protein HtpX